MPLPIAKGRLILIKKIFERIRQPRVDMELPMKNLFVRFMKDDSGATAIEYAMIAGLIAVVVLAGILLLGDSLTGLYGTNEDKLGSAIGGGGAE